MADRTEQLIARVRDSVVGADTAIAGPWGLRRLLYCDYTASGRALAFLEDFLRDEVLPLYANTHSESSGTGLQTTRFREDARRIVARSVGAGPGDLVIFCGSGATAAVNKLIDVLELRLPAGLDERYRLSERIPAEERPVVFVGPYEHHSNEVPWRETIAEVVTIDEDADGHVDLAHLERELERTAGRPLRIGSFSAASNVTGIQTDTRAVARLLHRHGAHSFWDYAAAGPYVPIEVSPAEEAERADAIFLSPHKFVGGPGTPGILVARRSLFTNRVPSEPGGGTVTYVSGAEHRYVDDPVQREEGGTPAILGSIRAGLVFQLKDAIGAEEILAREHTFIQRAIRAWEALPQLRILGNPRAKRLGIVSLMVRHGEGFLHHDYVVALLNDLFGIQARGGCSCAGPYGHRLLGIGPERSRAFEAEVLRGSGGIKPGWVRLGFNYFFSPEDLDYVIEAVSLIAREGWKLLPAYRFDPARGLWTHREHPEPAVLRLDELSYATGRLQYRARRATEPESALSGYLEEARALLGGAAERLADPLPDDPPLPEGFEALRWFPLPREAAEALRADG
jgi:selenocysteine lyase/cysteine desulfurase